MVRVSLQVAIGTKLLCILKLLTQKWHTPLPILLFQCHFDYIWYFTYFSSL